MPAHHCSCHVRLWWANGSSRRSVIEYVSAIPCHAGWRRSSGHRTRPVAERDRGGNPGEGPSR